MARRFDRRQALANQAFLAALRRTAHPAFSAAKPALFGGWRLKDWQGS